MSAATTREQRRRQLGIDCADRVVWKNWQAGGQYTRRLVIKNVDTRAQTLVCNLPERKTTFLTPFPIPVTLSSGLSYALELRFCPTQLVELHDLIEVHVNGRGSFVVYLDCLVPFAQLSVPASHNFGFCAVADTATRVVTVTNTGTVPLSFAWDVAAPFVVQPAQATLPQSASMPLTLLFRPTRACAVVAEAVCHMSGIDRPIASMRLSGVGKFSFVLLQPAGDDDDDVDDDVQADGQVAAVAGDVCAAAVTDTTRDTTRATAVDVHDGVGGAVRAHALQMLSPREAMLDFGGVLAGSTVTRSFYVVNPTPVTAFVALQCERSDNDNNDDNNNNDNNDDNDDDVDGAARAFTVTPDTCVVARGARQRVRVTYTARGVGGLHSGVVVVRVRAGNVVRVQLQGRTIGLCVALSTSYVNYGEVNLEHMPSPKQRTRYVQLCNRSATATRYQVLCTSPGAAFAVAPCAGELPAKGVVRLCIVFCPSAPIHYLRRLLLLVRDAATALYVDVFGSAYDRDTRPLPFGLRDVECFYARQARGLGLLTPSQLEAHAARARCAATQAALSCTPDRTTTTLTKTTTTMRTRRVRRHRACAGRVCLDAVAASLMGGADARDDGSGRSVAATALTAVPLPLLPSSPPPPQPFYLDTTLLTFDEHRSAAVAAVTTTTTTTTSAVVAVRSVRVCNATHAAAVAVWCVPVDSAYAVTPMQHDVPPGGACNFVVAMQRTTNAPASCHLECYVNYAQMRSYRLSHASSFTPPHCLTLQCCPQRVAVAASATTAVAAAYAPATAATAVAPPRRLPRALAGGKSNVHNHNNNHHHHHNNNKNSVSSRRRHVGSVMTADALVHFPTCRVGAASTQLLTLTNTSDTTIMYEVRDVVLRSVDATVRHDVAAVVLPARESAHSYRSNNKQHNDNDDDDDDNDDVSGGGGVVCDDKEPSTPTALAATARYSSAAAIAPPPTPSPSAHTAVAPTAYHAFTTSMRSNNNNSSSSASGRYASTAMDVDGVFAVYPAHGTLAPQQRALLLLRFAPRTHARYAAELTLATACASGAAAAVAAVAAAPARATPLSASYAGDATTTTTTSLVSVRLRGEGCTPRIDLLDVDAATLTFAPTCVTGATQRTLRLRNPTPLSLSYRLVPCAALREVLQFASATTTSDGDHDHDYDSAHDKRGGAMVGTLRGGQTTTLHVRFCPREARVYDGHVRIQLCETRRTTQDDASNNSDNDSNDNDDDGEQVTRDATATTTTTAMTRCAYVMTLSVRGEGAHGVVELSPTLRDLGRVAGLQPCATTLTLYNSGVCAVAYEVRVLVCASPAACWQPHTRAPQLRNHVGVLRARTHATVLVTVYPAAGRSEYVLYAVLRGGTGGDANDANKDVDVDVDAAEAHAHTAAEVRRRYPHCTLVVHGSRPAVQVVDVHSAAVPRSRLWRQLCVDAINVRLAAAVRPRDVDTQAYTFRQYIADVVPVGVDVGVAYVHAPALRATLRLRNVGDCAAHFHFLLPTEHDVSDEPWYAADAALHDVQAVLDRRLIEVAPRRGSIAVGASAVVTLTYRPAVVGVHTLPVLLRIGDGKRVLLALEGRTLPRHDAVAAVAWRHAPLYTLAPVALGDMAPPLQSLTFDNVCAYDVRYRVDTDALAALARAHHGFAVLQCVNPCGIVRAHDTARLLLYFRPLEARKYVMRMPVQLDGGECYALTLVGRGYDATRTPLAALRAAHERALPRLPCSDIAVHTDASSSSSTTAATTSIGSCVSLSPNVVRLGAVPYFSLHRRVIYVRNTHSSHTFAFAWQVNNTTTTAAGATTMTTTTTATRSRNDGGGRSKTTATTAAAQPRRGDARVRALLPDDDDDKRNDGGHDEHDDNDDDALRYGGDHAVYVQPACGVLPPGATCACRLVVYSGSASAVLEVSLQCHVRDETALDEEVRRACTTRSSQRHNNRRHHDDDDDHNGSSTHSGARAQHSSRRQRRNLAAAAHSATTTTTAADDDNDSSSSDSSRTTATRAPATPRRAVAVAERVPHTADGLVDSASDADNDNNNDEHDNSDNDATATHDTANVEGSSDKGGDDGASRRLRDTQHRAKSGKDVSCTTRRVVAAATTCTRAHVSVTVPPVRSLGLRALQTRVAAARHALHTRRLAATAASEQGSNDRDKDALLDTLLAGDSGRGSSEQDAPGRGRCYSDGDDDDEEAAGRVWQAHELLLQMYVMPVGEYERVYGARALSQRYLPALVDTPCTLVPAKPPPRARATPAVTASAAEMRLLHDILDELLRGVVATPQVQAAFAQPFVRRDVRYTDLLDSDTDSDATDHDDDDDDDGDNTGSRAHARSLPRTARRVDDCHRHARVRGDRCADAAVALSHDHNDNNDRTGARSVIVPSAIEEVLEQLVFAAVTSLSTAGASTTR